jgi:hypothetical protein
MLNSLLPCRGAVGTGVASRPCELLQTFLSWLSACCVVQVAYDDMHKVAYLIGDTKLYIVDLSPVALLDNGSPASTPRPLSVLQTLELNLTVNDVAFCGGLLAISTNAADTANTSGKVLPGGVTILNNYRRESEMQIVARGAGSLEVLAQFTVGELALQLSSMWMGDLHTHWQPLG